MKSEPVEPMPVRPLTGAARAGRRIAAVAMAGALALGGAIAQPAEAAVKAKVDVPLLVGTAVATPIPFGANGTLIPMDYGWMATEDGKSWFDVDVPESVWTRDFVAMNTQNAFVGYTTESVHARVKLKKGAKPEKMPAVPEDSWRVVHQENGVVYLQEVGSDREVWYQASDGARSLLDTVRGGSVRIGYVDGCRVSWYAEEWEPQPSAWTVLFDTCAGTQLATFDGDQLRIEAYADGAVTYVEHDYDTEEARVCRRPLAGGADRCLTGKFVVEGFLGGGVLTTPQDQGAVPTYRFYDIATKKSAWTFTGDCGWADEQIACADASGSIFRMGATGRQGNVGKLPKVKTWAKIALGGADLYLVSRTGGTISRIQSDGKKVGAPKQLSAGRDVSASAARAVVGNTLLDRAKVTKKAFLPARATAGRMSGPYVTYTDFAVDRSYVKRTDGKTLLSTADKIVDVFGPRALVQSDRALRVVDVESGKTIASRSVKSIRATGLWGDLAYYTTYDETRDKIELFEWNYVTDGKGAKKARQLKAGIPTTSGEITDGLLAFDDAIVNPVTDKLTWHGGRVEAATNNRVAYAVETQRPDKVRVETLDFGGKSAPRMLGVVAKSSIKSGDAWTPEIDFSKPLLKGKLEIRDAKKKLVATVKLPATADGSYRGVGWDGKDTKGVPVKAGTYTWTVKATDDPARTGLKKGQEAQALDGKSAASGKIKVSLKTFAKSATPKVSGTAKVGSKLKAKAGTWSPKPTFTYQWLRNGKSIKGAKKSSYTVTSSDKGKKISVKVKGSKAGYKPVSTTSKATSKVK